MTRPRTGWLITSAGLIALMLGTSGLQAQQVYRSVGPDGRVSFSDQPPVAGQGEAVAPRGAATGTETHSALPYELRQVAGRYPVTLYTGDNCGPCGSARTFLSQRGIPFTEKTVATNEDIEALGRLSGGNGSLPFLTIGSQQLKGYADSEWTQFLDAAGYPKISQLPASYRQTPATPLVSVQRPSAAVPLPTAKRSQPAPVIPNDNPAGIRF